MIRIAIADDHNLVRDCFALALKTDPNMQVVALAENGKMLLDLVEKTQPDVILLDLEMPVMSGWEALGHLKEKYPSAKVVIVSMHFQALLIHDLVAKGAKGFLPKNADFEILINAIHEVNDLGYFFSDKINRAIVRDLLTTNSISPLFRSPELSTIEIAALHLVCEDKVAKEIATILGVTVRTVDRIKKTLYQKTGTKTPAGLVLFALKKNLIASPL